MSVEAFSRVVIDRKLRESGWDIENQREVNFEVHSSSGRADYVLMHNGKPLAIIEAKKPEIDPYQAKQQALDYVNNHFKTIKYIFLANDHMIYFWDITFGDAAPINAFHSKDDLLRKYRNEQQTNVEPLTKILPDENYFHDKQVDINVRGYQLEAFLSIAKAYDDGKRKFLLEMATGTGKTVLGALIISRFIRTHQAENVLFLVDRTALARQTKAEFEPLLEGLTKIGTYWGSNKKDLVGTNVVVATIQSLQLHGKRDFSPGYFDLIIHDEAHRSIYTPQARAAVEHFSGATQIGLTATPKDFLKNVDVNKLQANDPRKLERRLQLDTYSFFECEKSTPTYRYAIKDAVEDGYLVPGRIHKMYTDITQKVLQADGLTLEDGDIEGGGAMTIKMNQLEKKVSFPNRNKRIAEEILAYAEKDKSIDEIGKTLVFAVSQQHALDLEKAINALVPEHYGGQYAEVITSYTKKAVDRAKHFSKINERLPRIAITVDMLATGYNARSVQNIVLARPIFEPTLYQQIKGRGTRLCPEIGKTHYTIFDFCGVAEYFDEKYDWEAPKKIPRPATEKTYTTPTEDSSDGEGSNEGGGGTVNERPVSNIIDTVASRDLIDYGPDGDKVDRQMYQDEWTKAVHRFVQSNPDIESIVDNPEKTDELINAIHTGLLNQPNHYFTADTLKKAYGIVGSIREFFMDALGKEQLASKKQQQSELIDSLVSKYGQTNTGPAQRRALMVELLARKLVQDKELLGYATQSVQNNNLSFLAKHAFAGAYSSTEWLQTLHKEDIYELVQDISNSELVNI